MRSSRGTEESRFAKASLLANTQAGEGNLIQTGIFQQGNRSKGTLTFEGELVQEQQDEGYDQTRMGTYESDDVIFKYAKGWT